MRGETVIPKKDLGMESELARTSFGADGTTRIMTKHRIKIDLDFTFNHLAEAT